MEITPSTFAELHQRLLDHLRQMVHNGEVSERSLARRTGISQPHIHNVLKGAKALSPDLADIVLAHLRLTPLDLFGRDELTEYLAGNSPYQEQRLHPVPVLDGLIGLAHPLPRKGPHREIHTVPHHLTRAATDPLVVRLAADPEMAPLFQDRDLVLLDQSETARTLFQAEGYYVVGTPDGPCVRSLRRVDGEILLATEKDRDNAAAWKRLPLDGRDLLDIILARIIWLNRQRRWEDHVA